MGKIKFAAEEFFRSFRKNLFKNVLLMVMFSIGMAMTVLMGSYYLDLGELDPDTPSYRTEDGTWYVIGVGDENTLEMEDSIDTVQGCRNMMEYYERLHDSAEHPVISVHTQQDCFVREDDLQALFGNVSYDNFIDEDNPDAVMTCFASEDDGDMCSVLGMKCIMLDDTAFGIFGLRTEKGEGFTKSNLTIQNASDPIPIVLGNEYEGIVSVGQTIDISFLDFAYPCRVAGILEKGSMIPDGASNSIGDDMMLLDSHIIFPYTIRVTEETGNRTDIARYAARDLMALEFSSSMVWVKDEKDFRDVVAMFRDIGNEFNFPPLELYDASMGLRLLRKESEARVRIMLILTLALIGFTFYGLFATFYDKIQSNKKTYGIYQMNGCSIGMILFPYLFEIAVILSPAFFVCRYLFSEENIGYVNGDMILKVTGCFIGLAFLTGAVFVICLLKGVDTEQLIRQKD